MFPNEPVRDLEQKKFRDVGNGNRAVAVLGVDQNGNPIEPETFAWDSFTVAYPTPTTEIYTFTLASNVVRVVTLNYTDETKKDLASGSKV